MDCPHCGSETLMGATHCVACGESLFAPPAGVQDAPPVEAPAPRLPPKARAATESGASPPGGDPGDDLGFAHALPTAADAHAPVPTPAVSMHCKLCFGSCSAEDAGICSSCRDVSSAAPRADTATAGSYADRLGSKQFRPVRTVHRRGRGRAVALVVLAIAAIAGGVAVVRATGGAAPSLRLVRDAAAEPARVGDEIPGDVVYHYRTELDLRLQRGESKNSFDRDLSGVFDVRQISTCSSDVTLAGRTGGAPDFDVQSTCALDRQEGEWQLRDGSKRELYPWRGHIDRVRVRAPASGGLTTKLGRVPTPARDVPPFLRFSQTAPADADLVVGESWSATVALPGLVAREGALPAHPFDCRFEYAGRQVVNGRRCAILHVTARPTRDLDTAAFPGLERAAGSVEGSLAFDEATGLLVEADLAVDLRAESGASRLTDRVASAGRLRVTVR